MQAGIAPVKAARSVGARRHAASASDAAVVVHHDDAVFALPGGADRADPGAGRVVAVIAQHHQGPVLQILAYEFMLFTGEPMFVCFLPEPLDLLLRVAYVRHIVNLVTDVHAVGAIDLALSRVDEHGPPARRQCVGVRLIAPRSAGGN